MKYKFLFVIVVCFLSSIPLFAQTRYELDKAWTCKRASLVQDSGAVISDPAYAVTGWMPAVVPGTVLTTLLHNHLVPDPFYGMNNKAIPDIYDTGGDYYTYWFVKDFKEDQPQGDKQVWLHFRGVNYRFDVYLNGRKLNVRRQEGMFLRHTYNITAFLRQDGNNRLAVIVYPPDPVGNPNGGQGGDGTIARSVTNQYVAGWDWIQPVRDRNTGIWDKVWIERTGPVNILHPHVATFVPGKRHPGGKQQPAIIQVTAELENPTTQAMKGTLQYELGGRRVSRQVSVPARSIIPVRLPDLRLRSPKLWWPNGYGPQHLYATQLTFIGDKKAISDKEQVSVGVRSLETSWNAHTRSRQLSVNGQKIFVKGGNWIASDALLRLSPQRYDAEVRFHRDMNLNLIRVWGGGLLERPEFYQACDKYGLLVMQDLWMTGDCNGRWRDPKKLDDRAARRAYPDDHGLFIRSVADQMKMIRNHPSLAFWCGGNEITPPEDILAALKDSVLPAVDSLRWFVDYSNSDSMSLNFLGGGGDGPYGIQPIRRFWSERTYPFNSEVGSVGLGDYESLQRFIPAKDMVVPQYNGPGRRSQVTDSVWEYHKYIGYNDFIAPYGKAAGVRDFAEKAQLVNYDQYRALAEGFSAHMWDWYTGVIIWKTQNPWTALRGQMYDCYLDPNAGLYGLHAGSEPLHVMFNPADSTVVIANNTFSTYHDLEMTVKVYDIAGRSTPLADTTVVTGATQAAEYLPLARELEKAGKREGVFLSLRLKDDGKKTVSDNLYWLPDAEGVYTGLQHMEKTDPDITARRIAPGKVSVRLKNAAGNPIAFFCRLSLVNPATKERILPVFYSDNYLSVLPGEEQTVTLEFTPAPGITPVVAVRGWNVGNRFVEIE